MLNANELLRYQRQIALDEVGYQGQKKLKSASVLCIGAGGLGCSVCLYLVAAGVGVIGIVDQDTISLDNLHRQILFHTSECDLPKAEQAKLHLEKINPHCKIELHNKFVTKENVLDIIQAYDIVVDCSDNFEARYLINDACCVLNKPNVFSSVQKFKGYCTVFSAVHGPCYRCLFETMPENRILNCAESGILGTVPGILGTLQANEVLKLILAIGESLVGRVLIFNTLLATTKIVHLTVSPTCKFCSSK